MDLCAVFILHVDLYFICSGICGGITEGFCLAVGPGRDLGPVLVEDKVVFQGAGAA